MVRYDGIPAHHLKTTSSHGVMCIIAWGNVVVPVGRCGPLPYRTWWGQLPGGVRGDVAHVYHTWATLGDDNTGTIARSC